MDGFDQSLPTSAATVPGIQPHWIAETGLHTDERKPGQPRPSVAS